MGLMKKLNHKNEFASGVKPLSEVKRNLVVLVYGRSGTGKTHFMSTFPKPLLLIDVNERGTETIAPTPDIDVRTITHWSEWESGRDWLKAGQKYKSVIIDQITALQDMGMRHVREKAKKRDTDLFTRRNWGELSGLLKNTLSEYRDLSDQYHMGFVAHMRVRGAGEDDDDEGIEPNVGAQVMPSVAVLVDGAVDVIGNTFIRENFARNEKGKRVRTVEYCMRLGPHAVYTTKIRRPVEAGPVPESIVDPSFRKISDLIAGKSLKKRLTKEK